MAFAAVSRADLLVPLTRLSKVTVTYRDLYAVRLLCRSTTYRDGKWIGIRTTPVHSTRLAGLRTEEGGGSLILHAWGVMYQVFARMLQ